MIINAIPRLSMAKALMSEFRLSNRIALFLIAVLFALNLQGVQAQEYNVLQECMKLSNADADINNCLDNYLDLMDDNITDISTYIANDLPDSALDQFQLSQQAFIEYRKQNCLWYLEFSAPRELAEKIAKNCLAQMSQDRLAELQSLIATNGGQENTLRGFYVYGANRNSFQPCGSDQRYWVEGDDGQVGQLQQDYLSKSTASLQVLYVELRGQIDTSQSYPEHSGTVQLVAVSEIKLPSDGECSLPAGAADKTLASAPEIKPAAVPETESAQGEPADEASEQVLRAYFGEWLAECEEKQSDFVCRLSVEFDGENVTQENRPNLSMSRRTDQRTLISMNFPEREVDSPAKIRWRIDKYNFGDIVGSNIRVDEDGTRQLVHEKKFIRDDLLPLFKEGTELSVEVLANVDDDAGERYTATLEGLTRALNFADDFVASGGEL